MNAHEEIKHLYYNTTRTTITRDLIRAVTLLKSMASEAERERAAVYMDGLAQMRSEWASAGAQEPRKKSSKQPKPKRGR
jgi:hypothetical protein